MQGSLILCFPGRPSDSDASHNTTAGCSLPVMPRDLAEVGADTHIAVQSELVCLDERSEVFSYMGNMHSCNLGPSLTR